MTDAHSLADFRAKNERNARVQARYDELMHEGKHGHYETMNRVVREEVEAALRQPPAQTSEWIDIVFDGPPGPEAGRFVEVENAEGRSIRFGDWVERPDGYWVLRITRASLPSEKQR